MVEMGASFTPDWNSSCTHLVYVLGGGEGVGDVGGGERREKKERKRERGEDGRER